MSDTFKDQSTLSRRGFIKISSLILTGFLVGVKRIAAATRDITDRILKRIQAAYSQDAVMTYRKSQNNPQVQALYNQYLGDPLGETSLDLLHTQYVDRSGSLNRVNQHAQHAGPKRLHIRSAYPNPFNQSTQLELAVFKAGLTKLEIFDSSGRHVRTLMSKYLGRGTHNISWNGTDERGQVVSSGLYIAALTGGGMRSTTRMMMVK